MKKINIIFLFALAALTLTSCDTFLDKLPDDRAEVNTLEKARQLLVTAYPTNSPNYILEFSSDNVMDNGAQYSAQPQQDQVYRFEDIDQGGNDDPYSIWEKCYIAIGTANQALDALNTMGAVGGDAEADELRAEALLCRAYSAFQLGNLFCLAYSPDNAATALGIPYPKAAGETVNERGTMEELYANINADIEAALPMVGDAHLDRPKYHFNTKAAYAFAARFNLYYMNYDKAIEYATKALGSNPASVLRNTSLYAALGGVDAIANAYVQSGEKANLMLNPAYSIIGRGLDPGAGFDRFNHSRPIVTNETFWAKMPWGTGSGPNTLYESHLLYGADYSIYYPKMEEMFEYTDKVNGTGYTHITDAVFTTDETLLVRAEAKALKGDTNGALEDMNTWVSVRCAPSITSNGVTATRPNLTEASVNAFFDALPEVPVIITIDTPLDTQRGIKKPLHPQGFTVAPGTQTNLIYCILQMRRVETYKQGLRFLDIKRYGIEYSHNIDGEDPVVFTAGDKRGAIQLPSQVITAGLEANPR